MRHGRPHRKLTLVQISFLQRRRAQGEKYEVLMSDFHVTKQFVWYLTKGKGRIQRGICRYCFCTERTPCLVSASAVDKVQIGCSWLDDSRTVCSSYNCRVAHQRSQQREETN